VQCGDVRWLFIAGYYMGMLFRCTFVHPRQISYLRHILSHSLFFCYPQTATTGGQLIYRHFGHLQLLFWQNATVLSQCEPKTHIRGVPPKRDEMPHPDQRIVTFSTNFSIPPDVAIEIFETTYHLHSAILRHCSGFFDRNLSAALWNENNMDSGRNGIKYRYQLKVNRENLYRSMVEPVVSSGWEMEETAKLRWETKTTSGLTITGHKMGWIRRLDGYDSNVSSDRYRTGYSEIDLSRLKFSYSQLFSIYYHKPLQIINDLMIHDIEKVARLAEAYGNLPVISDAIHTALFKWLLMGGNMGYYCDIVIDIACQIRSAEFFNEAFVHLASQWRVYSHPCFGFPRVIKDHTLQEHVRIQGLKERADRKFAYFMTAAALAEYNTDRYAAKLEKTTQREIETAFEQLGQGGTEGDFYRRISNISGPWADQYLKPLVAPLVVCNLKLSQKEHRHLTCAKFEGEYPWVNVEEDQLVARRIS